MLFQNIEKYQIFFNLIFSGCGMLVMGDNDLAADRGQVLAISCIIWQIMKIYILIEFVCKTRSMVALQALTSSWRRIRRAFGIHVTS